MLDFQKQLPLLSEKEFLSLKKVLETHSPEQPFLVIEEGTHDMLMVSAKDFERYKTVRYMYDYTRMTDDG